MFGLSRLDVLDRTPVRWWCGCDASRRRRRRTGGSRRCGRCLSTWCCGVSGRTTRFQPAAGSGPASDAAGLLGHLGNATASRPAAGWWSQPRRLPESLDLGEVAVFVADLGTARDRAMALGMLLGGLRSAEIRSLRLADIDFGLRRVRVVGKGGKERVVPVDGDFFAETSRLSARGTPAGLRDAGVFRGAPRPDPRAADG